jgi:hypothetical protein
LGVVRPPSNWPWGWLSHLLGQNGVVGHPLYFYFIIIFN